MWVLYLGQEDPLEEKMATHSSILAWSIPWTEEPDRLQSMGTSTWGLGGMLTNQKSGGPLDECYYWGSGQCTQATVMRIFHWWVGISLGHRGG